jgi:hypothetical protein
MKASNLALCNLLLSPATVALRGPQKKQGQQQPFAAKSLKPEIADQESRTVYIQADDSKDSRSPPNDGYIDQDAYAKLRNDQDVIDQGVVFEAEIGELVSPANPKGKRVKGAQLTAEGVNFVTILPEEMNDCDSELMESMVVDSSTCATVLDTSREGGGVALEVNDEEEVEMYGEEDYIRELMAETEGIEFAARYFTDDGPNRRLNYDTGMTSDIGVFEPLRCNLNENNVSILRTGEECDANPDGLMSTLVAGAGDGAVVIPCGKCIKVRPLNTPITC